MFKAGQLVAKAERPVVSYPDPALKEREGSAVESAQPRNRSVVTRPFPRRRAGSEYETKRRRAGRGQTVNKGRYV